MSDASNSLLLDDLTSILSSTAIAANNLPYKVTKDHVIVGDFNIHYHSWGCKTEQADNRAHQLLKIIVEFNLTQHLLPETTKYISPLGSESTIDLVLTSAELTEKIQMSDVVEALDHNSKHVPIGTILDLSLQNTATNIGHSYDQTNTEGFKNTLSASLLLTSPIPPALEVVDKNVIQLINAISHALYISTRQTLLNVWVTRGLNEFCKVASVNTNKARRHLKEKKRQDPKSRGTKQAYVTYQKARACKKQLVQSTLRQHHQKPIEEAKEDENKTWKVVQ